MICSQVKQCLFPLFRVPRTCNKIPTAYSTNLCCPQCCIGTTVSGWLLETSAFSLHFHLCFTTKGKGKYTYYKYNTSICDSKFINVYLYLSFYISINSPLKDFHEYLRLGFLHSRAVALRFPNAETLWYSSSCCGDTPHHKIISFLLHNCNFVAVMNHNINMIYRIIWYVTHTHPKWVMAHRLGTAVEFQGREINLS